MPGAKKDTSSFDGWKVVVQTFVADILNHVRGDIREHARAWACRLRDRSIGFVFMIIGSIFISISLAILLNTLLVSTWAGYGAIGVLVLAFGVIISNRQ